MTQSMRIGGLVLLVCLLAAMPTSAQDLQYANSTYWTGVNDIEVSGYFAYCCFGPGLVIYDVSGLAFPIQASRIFIQGSNRHIELADNYAYIFGKNDKLRMIDITSPIEPFITDEFDIAANVSNIRVEGDYIFAAAGSMGLLIIDKSNPEQLELISQYDTESLTTGIAVVGNYAYIIEKPLEAESPSFQILDITDISNPSTVGSLTHQLVSPTDIIIDGARALIADAQAGFTIVDISDPAAPSVITQLPGNTSPHNLFLNDVYVFMDNDNTRMQVFDITDPANPVLTSECTPEKPIMDFDLEGVKLFTAGSFDGISILDVYDVYNIYQLTEIDRMGAISSAFMVEDVLYLGQSCQGFMLHDLDQPVDPNLSGHLMTPYQYNYAYLSDSSIFVFENSQMGEIYIPDPQMPLHPMYMPIDENYTSTCIGGPYLYLTKAEGGIDIYRQWGFVALQYIRSFEWSGQSGNVVIDIDRAYIAQYPNVCIFDISDPADSVLLGSFEPANQVEHLWLFNGYLYVSGNDEANNLLSVYDCSDPEHPLLIDEITFSGAVLDIMFDSDMAFFAIADYGLYIYDCIDPTNHTLIDSFRTPDNINGIARHGDYLYLADNSSLIVLSFAITGIDSESLIPASYSLAQNYPNPFNATTTISYSLPEPADVTLEIYDILGRQVYTLLDGFQTAGEHSVNWNANGVSSGIYFYRLNANNYSEMNKMILLK